MSQLAHYSAATLARAAGGRVMPSLEVTLAYVAACGGDMAEWRSAWTEVSQRAGDAAPITAQQVRELARNAERRVPEHVPPRQLPGDMTDFVGRVQQVREVHQVLTTVPDNPGAIATCVVSGIGGVGKSTLAVHVAHLVARDYPDGQFYVHLAGMSKQPADPGEVLARLLRDLGVPPSEVPADPDERVLRYRSMLANRRFLIVLDDARNAAQVRPLLPGTPGNAVIVTSRSSLGDLAGARRVDLAQLDIADGHELFARIVGRQRTDREAEATEQVVRSCAGLPLAIRSSAARLAARPSWQIAELADRLAREENRLAQLKYGDLAVRASFGLSYESMSPEATRVFRLLGTAPLRTFAAGAVAALLGERLREAEDVLDDLCYSGVLDEPVPGRYGMHDLIRLFANEIASESPRREHTDALSRLVAWYMSQLREAVVTMAPGRPLPPVPEAKVVPSWPRTPQDFGSQSDAVSWCQREEENLPSVIRAAAERGWREDASALACISTIYFIRYGSPSTFATIQRIGLDCAQDLRDEPACGWLLTGLGIALKRSGDSAGAIEAFEKALEVRQRLRDHRSEAVVRSNLGLAYHELGRYDMAARYYTGACADCEKIGDHWTLGLTLNNLGETFIAMNDPGKAAAAFRQATDLLHDAGDQFGEAAARTGLAEALRRSGQLNESLKQHEIALTSHRDQGTRNRELLLSLERYGRTLDDAGHRENAMVVLTEALDLARLIGDSRTDQLASRVAALTRGGQQLRPAGLEQVRMTRSRTVACGMLARLLGPTVIKPSISIAPSVVPQQSTRHHRVIS